LPSFSVALAGLGLHFGAQEGVLPEGLGFVEVSVWLALLRGVLLTANLPIPIAIYLS
jgi:hypothetical protein